MQTNGGNDQSLKAECEFQQSSFAIYSITKYFGKLKTDTWMHAWEGSLEAHASLY